MVTVTSTRVFNRALNPSQINLSDRFIGADFVYLLAPDVTFELEIDTFLQIYLQPVANPSLSRLVRINSPTFNVLNTEIVTLIPDEFKGYEMQLALIPSSSESLFLEAWVSAKSGCECDEKLDELSNKLDICVLTNVVSSVIDIVTTGVFDGILNAGAKKIADLLPGKKIRIINPAPSLPQLPGSPIFLDFLPKPVDYTNINKGSFETIIQPGFSWTSDLFNLTNHELVGWTSDGSIINNINVRQYG